MFVEFKLENLETFPQKLQTLLDDQLKKIDDITNSSESSYEKVSKPLQDLDEELGLFFTPLAHINSVLNSKESQKAYEESLPLLSKFHSTIAQNEALFHKLEKLSSSDSSAQKVIDNDIRDFKLSGIDLPEKQKKELEAINLELSQLGNSFSQNLLDATNEYELIIEDYEDVKELDKSDIEQAKIEKDGKEVYRFTLQMPSYIAYMTYGSNRKYREELYRAYNTRAPQNAEVIDRLLELRDKKAKMLGFESFAEYSLADKDAKSTDDVVGFLEELTKLSKAQAKEELLELQNFAKALDGIEELASYDVGYYAQKLKKKQFDFDDSMTKPYFEQGRVVDALLGITSKLFGVEIKEVEMEMWHKCVRTFDIYEKGEVLSRLYIDLEAREEKRGGAWMNDFETRFIDSNGKAHLASAFIVCNFSPTTETTPSLLRHDDVVTLFHEMGHALHHILSKESQRSVSGINGVAWDVVEFPSQFLENFAYEKAILETFAFHYESGEPMSEELLNKIKESKNFQSAMGLIRQVEFSLFDFKLHQSLHQGEEVQGLLDSIRQETSVIKVPEYNKFQHGFAHIFAGGYAAGYYSYKWAEVLSADAFFECMDESGFNTDKAQGYKDHILANGGAKEMSELYKQWLGRESRAESLIRLYEINS
jgi:oligopeptidase A